jgi:hypothetical protein
MTSMVASKTPNRRANGGCFCASGEFTRLYASKVPFVSLYHTSILRSAGKAALGVAALAAAGTYVDPSISACCLMYLA